MTDLAKAIQGVKWNYAATAAQTVAQLTFVAVVARLLEPAAFGTMAIATVMVRFGSYLSGAGIRSYLIQKKALSGADVQAAFVLTSCTGVLLCLVTISFAPVAAELFDAPAAEPVIRVLSLAFLAQGLTIPAAALLQRSLRFKAIALIETAAYVVGYNGIGLLLAFGNFGVWSLVGAALSQQALVLIMSVAASPHRIGFAFGRAELEEVVSKGSHFAFNTVLDYCVIAAPTLVVGRLYGAAADLGLYNRSSTLINLPAYAVSSAVSRVVLPYMAPLQTDRSRLAKTYSRCATFSTLLFLPLCLGMIPAASEIVLFVLGDGWSDAIPVFQVLGIATAMHLVNVQLGTCADAVRRLKTRTMLSVATLISTVCAMYALSAYGLAGAAAGVAVGQALRLGLYLWLLARWFRLTAASVLDAYAPGVIVGVAVACSVGFVHEILGDAPTAVALAAEVIAGGASFSVAVLLYPSQPFKAALRTLLEHIGVTRRVRILDSAFRLAGLQ